MRPFVLLCFLLALLPLGILAHDLYLAYQEAERSRVEFGSKPINFSDIGWLWVQYSPDTYDWARRSVDADIWKNIVDPLSQQTALILAVVPVTLLASILTLVRVLKDMPIMVQVRSGGRQKKADGGIAIKGLEKKKKKLSYKRK